MLRSAQALNPGGLRCSCCEVAHDLLQPVAKVIGLSPDQELMGVRLVRGLVRASARVNLLEILALRWFGMV